MEFHAIVTILTLEDSFKFKHKAHGSETKKCKVLVLLTSNLNALTFFIFLIFLKTGQF